MIAALPAEISMFTGKAIKQGEVVHCGQMLVCAAGIGAQNATKASQLVHRQGATILVSWGCAGALDPTLSAGDLILPEQVSDNNSCIIDTAEILNQKLLSECSGVKTMHSGLLAQSPTMITSSQQKKTMFESSSAIAVDMESFSIGDYARKNKLPFIACRAIADTASTDLPPPVLNAMDQQGHINNRQVILNTLLQPMTIVSLIQLGIHFNQARATLSSIATKLTRLTCQPAQSSIQ